MKLYGDDYLRYMKYNFTKTFHTSPKSNKFALFYEKE